MKVKTLAPWASLCFFALLYFHGVVQAAGPTENLDWAEEPTPPPPALSKSRLIPIDMPLHVAVKVAVDPDSISVGGDGVVRYVLVVTNTTGTTSAFYEGVRCITDEVKTYARLGSSGQWTLLESPTWKPVSDNLPAGLSFAFARQGGCQNRLATSKVDIISALKAPSKVAPSLKGY